MLGLSPPTQPSQAPLPPTVPLVLLESWLTGAGGFQAEDGAPQKSLTQTFLMPWFFSLRPSLTVLPPVPRTTTHEPQPCLRTGWWFCVSPMPQQSARPDSHGHLPRLLTSFVQRPSPHFPPFSPPRSVADYIVDRRSARTSGKYHVGRAFRAC